MTCFAQTAAAFELPEPLSVQEFLTFDAKQAALGQLLFYDKVLSGNRNIACATCHHHDLGGADGLSLGIGEGGNGLGEKRTPGTGSDRVAKRIPRNAPALWNLGHKDISVLFHDGRLEVSDLYGNGFDSPAEEWLPKGLPNIIAAQAVFPITAEFEMAGNPKENEVAGAVHNRIDAAWPIIAKRVRIIPEYGDAFTKAFDHIDRPEDVTIVEIASAIAAFIGTEWQNFDSPFDAYLAGDSAALAADQLRGMELFYGKAGCAACHSGPLLTDQGFHAIGLPAFGPGRTRRFDPFPRDLGRMGFTDRLEDAYRFRTPPLRNVTLTGPYGHNGAYADLRAIVQHHLSPELSLALWRPRDAVLPPVPWLHEADLLVQSDTREMARQAAALELTPINLEPQELDDLVAFLHALTGKTALTRPFGVPQSVPSGLPVDRMD